MENFDVIVVGGGPAGSSAALSLARVGLAVAILERSDLRNLRVGETLPPAIKAPLSFLQLWEMFVRDSPSNSPAIYSAWGGEALHEQNHFYSPYGTGWHIDRMRFDAMLAHAAQEAGAILKKGARVVACKRGPSDGWAVEFQSGQARHLWHGRFLVDATGRSSFVARQLEVRRVLHDNLVAIVGFFTRSSEVQSPSPVTLVEAAENGWWYSASLPDSRLVIAYMTDADLYARGRKQSTSNWQEQLSHSAHTQDRVKGWTLDSSPLIVQANSSRLEQVCGNNWLAVGDAAIAFDPISGQGVYRSLECGIRAGGVVQAFLSGDHRVLARYADTSRQLFHRFLTLRGKYYSQEQRWPNSVFWVRRRAGLSY